jgi:4-aminobutyrate aminotransferase-like enzyme/Ser/Thr protein kinase RdoA (MazF antagonist)
MGMSRVLAEPAPAVDADSAARTAAEHFGLAVRADPLPAERDRNFLLRCADGQRLVLKVSHSAEDPAVVAMETAAMRHVELVDPGLAVPRICPTRSGADWAQIRAGDGRTHLVRLITVVPGTPADQVPLPGRFAGEFGGTSARLGVALRGFSHPAATRALDWDLRDIAARAAALSMLDDDSSRRRVETLLHRLGDLHASTRGLPGAVLHGDLTPSNVLVEATGAVTGVIDFGDLHHTARAVDLAVSLCALLREAADPWRAARDFLDGYQRVTLLEPAEVEVLGELVLARATLGLLIGAQLAALHPDNRDYVTVNDAGNRRVLDQLATPAPELAARFHRICGTGRALGAGRPDPGLRRRRDGVLGTSLAPLFYRTPLQLTRGAGAYLHAADGRRYLDAYNNVPVVGHSHPAVVQAISRQSAVLNINSRYLHPNAVELAERLLATMPPELDTCVFANSGSEVNDLAWRMATLYTGHTGAVVTDHAYHGVSAATAAMSTNSYPAARRPPHVAVFRPPLPLPDGRPADAAAALSAVRGARAELHRHDHEMALLTVDTVFSSGGILEPGPDYLPALMDETRAAGGLFLADEVQAGFGRAGTHLWRFQDFGLAPDIVTLGKPMGNGHPVAALITRREIADRLAAEEEYFSTFGGNPVSCAAALAVLDVIEDAGLVERSGRIGATLRAGLRELTPHRPGPAVVRGPGLMIGVQLEPAGAPGRTAADVAEALRDVGVLVGTTGYESDTLKIRPPLIWDDDQVGEFLTAFAAALQ